MRLHYACSPAERDKQRACVVLAHVPRDWPEKAGTCVKRLAPANRSNSRASAGGYLLPRNRSRRGRKLAATCSSSKVHPLFIFSSSSREGERLRLTVSKLISKLRRVVYRVFAIHIPHSSALNLSTRAAHLFVRRNIYRPKMNVT